MRKSWAPWRAAFAAVRSPDEYDRVWRARFHQHPSTQRWPRIVNRDTELHDQIAQGFVDDPALLKTPPLPTDSARPVARRKRETQVYDWPKFFQHEQAPAPASDELHAGETAKVPASGRSFWSYAETTAR